MMIQHQIRGAIHALAGMILSQVVVVDMMMMTLMLQSSAVHVKADQIHQPMMVTIMHLI